jgi:hypothetical protein
MSDILRNNILDDEDSEDEKTDPSGYIIRTSRNSRRQDGEYGQAADNTKKDKI